MASDNPFSNQEIADYYNESCDHFGASHKALGWSSAYTQELRFFVLSLLGNWEGESVLDVGCGLGDFYAYLVKNELRFTYEGIDISPNMIALAQKTQPKADFKVLDILDSDFYKHYDYVVASGAFTVRVNDQYAYLKQNMQKMYLLSKKAMAFNCLSNRAEQQDQDLLFYYDPVRVLEMAFELSPYVEIRHHYLPNDFTVFVYK
ncbi:MAG: trans-aconitate 2-methyltransferase [Candidatus Margulisiibacteriota bacterium]